MLAEDLNSVLPSPNELSKSFTVSGPSRTDSYELDLDPPDELQTKPSTVRPSEEESEVCFHDLVEWLDDRVEFGNFNKRGCRARQYLDESVQRCVEDILERPVVQVFDTNDRYEAAKIFRLSEDLYAPYKVKMHQFLTDRNKHALKTIGWKLQKLYNLPIGADVMQGHDVEI